MHSGSCDFQTETDFENAFRDDISEEDKAYIYAVTTRLRRILNWNIEDDKRLYERANGPDIIREILSEFYRWKELVNESLAEDTHRICHLILFSLARLSLYYWLTDSRLVAEILSEVFDCDSHFSSMFAHIVNRHDGRSLLRQYSEFSKQREEYATLFFLHHAQVEKLQFNGIRFWDMRLRFPLSISPVFLAAIYNKPNLLLNLLRFGARIDRLPNRIHDDWNLPMVLRHLTRILWNSLGEDFPDLNAEISVNSVLLTSNISQVAECFRIILRVIPQIRMGEMDFLLMKFEAGVLSGSVWSHDFIRKLTEKEVVPTLTNRYLEPSDLRHLCRCVIRNRLDISWNLPYGISLLPLPKSVKNYLSLSMD